MNTRSYKEYRYIFTTTWNQANTSHLSSRLTDNVSGKLLIIFIFSCCQLPFCEFTKHNRTSLQVWHANVLYFCSFCKPTFSEATREWDALYHIISSTYRPFSIFKYRTGSHLCAYTQGSCKLNFVTSAHIPSRTCKLLKYIFSYTKVFSLNCS
jgi:hypothetical protein